MTDRECITHHHACDCREAAHAEEIAKLHDDLADVKERAENNRLSATHSADWANNAIEDMRKAEARADRLAAELKAACDDRDSYVRTLETVSASEDRLAAECERLQGALTRIASYGTADTVGFHWMRNTAREALSAQP